MKRLIATNHVTKAWLACRFIAVGLLTTPVHSIIECVNLPVSSECMAANRDGSESTGSTHWQSKRLSPLFYAEGGTVGDWNGEGVKDLVAGPLLYFGPSFEQPIALENVGPHNINGYSKHFLSFSHDVDQDGHVDIITVGFPGEPGYWHKNPGGDSSKSGNWPKYAILPSVDNESPMFSDMDGDKIPELICCHAGNFGYAKINADPTKPWEFIPVERDGKNQRFTHGIGVGDVDDDGRIDLLSKDGWWKCPESDRRQPWKFVPFAFSNSGGAQMYAVDLDGDGSTEVVTSLAAHGYGLAVYKKVKADGTEWQKIDIMTDSAESSPTGLAISQLHAVEIVDMDGDGRPDILTGKRFWAHNGNDPGENEPVYLVWFKPIKTGSGLRFVPNIIDNDSGVGTQITAADIDGDGLQDVFSVSKRGIHVLTQKKSQPIRETYKNNVAEFAIEIDDAIGGFRPAWSESVRMNLDFEFGDLRDWTSTGAAFFNQPVKGDVVHARRNDSVSNHQGEFWVGSYEITGDIAIGSLTSKPFQLKFPWISYLQGGGSSQESRFELVENDTGNVLITSHGNNSEVMKYNLHHLPNAVGKNVFVRLIDEGKGGWGHINFDDFRMHQDKPNIPKEHLIPPKDVITYRSLPADKVAGAMTLPEGFHAQVIASEPAVRQPIAMTIDAKGRVWVAEAYQYPIRAEGDFGKDRVLIFEDTDGDGTLDKSKVFIDNLNLVSGIEVGMGGLWVGAAPYLLFIPDENEDDVPDGPAIKKLTGWGYQDTHETLNSFIWGPDGWLYGCHGVFTHSDVKVVKEDGTVDDSKPGVKINAGIWRYRPQTETFEVFAHGTSNPWGLDFNDTGDAFLTACVIPHLYHIIPQARYQRQAGQHFNRFTYADIQTIARHRHWSGDNPHAGNNRSDSDGGGHAHSGAMFYLGGSWPEKYRNQLFMNNIHGARLNQDQIIPEGSGYAGDRAPDFLLANDQSSQILYFRTGPDGQMIAIDWYDAQQCHIVDPAQHDQSNGRIYRIAYGDAPAVKVDLTKESDLQLVSHLANSNEWYVRTARRILMERVVEKAKHLVSSSKQTWLEKPALDKLDSLLNDPDARIRLRAMWTLAACQQIDEPLIAKMIDDQDAKVRAWAIRFLSDWPQVSKVERTSQSAQQSILQKFSSKLLSMANEDSSPVVRLELASLCQKLSSNNVSKDEFGQALVLGLIQKVEDQHDHNLPLMYWYATSMLLENNPGFAVNVIEKTKIPLVGQYAAKQVTQQWLEDSKQESTFLEVLRSVTAKENNELICLYLDSVLDALSGVRSVAPPQAWTLTAAQLLNHQDSNVRQRGTLLATKLSDESALQSLLKVAQEHNALLEERVSALTILKQIKAAGLSEIGFKLLAEPKLRAAAISVIADSLDDSAAEKLLNNAKAWENSEDRRNAWFALLRRPNTAKFFLQQMEAGKIPAKELTADMVQQIVQLQSDEVQELLKSTWGEARSLEADKKQAFEKIKSIVEASGETPDLSQGKAVFAKICGQCHVLFGEGGRIGPELTGSNRRDISYLLENIVDPSAVMAKDYQPWIVRTVDDQVFTGLLKSSDQNSIKLQTATEEVVIYNDDVDEKKQSQTSMMPSDLLTPLSDKEIRALFAYLRSMD